MEEVLYPAMEDFALDIIIGKGPVSYTHLDVYKRHGYYYGDGGITGCVAKAEPDEALLKKLQATYAADVRKRPIRMFAVLQPGESAKLMLSCGAIFVEAAGEIVERAEKPQDVSRYAAQLQKLGATPFCVEHFALKMPEDAFLPMGKQMCIRDRFPAKPDINRYDALAGDERVTPAHNANIPRSVQLWADATHLPRKARLCKYEVDLS